MANTDIKWFSFDNTSAPQLTNTWGCMIDVLDACLVTGFGSQAISSILVSSGVAVATFGSPHGYKQFQVVEVTSEAHHQLEGEYKILGVSATTLEFEINLPDQTFTGAISGRLAPLGWTKAFSGEQKAVYQAMDIVANPYFLRVDNSKGPQYSDSYAKYAKVGILESCSGIDDLTGNQAPYDASNPQKNWNTSGSGSTVVAGWDRWLYAVHENTANGVAFELDPPTNGIRSWVLVGNKDSFYFVPNLTIATSYGSAYGFGVVEYNEIVLPFLIGLIKTQAANTSVVGVTGLTDPAHPVAALYDRSGQLNNTLFSKLISGFGGVKTGVSTNTVKADPLDGLTLTPFYLQDASNYIIDQIPIAKCCINDCSQIEDMTIFSDITGAHLMKKIRSGPGGPLGGIFLKIF